MKKSGYIVGLLLAAGGTLRAQEGASAYHFLQFPQSSHTSALGGANISAVDDEVSAAMNNPALLSTVSDRTLSLNFMTYAAGSKAVGAAFAKAFGERHTGAVAAQYLGYGTMDETDASGNVIGSFSAKDLSLTAGYAYLMSDRWAGGASIKMIYSKYAEFSSLAMAVDVGLNYYDVDADFSASLTLKNLGVQLKAFEDDHDHVPYDLQLGISKGMAQQYQNIVAVCHRRIHQFPSGLRRVFLCLVGGKLHSILLTEGHTSIIDRLNLRRIRDIGGIGEQGGFGGVILPRGASRLVKHMFSRLASLAFLRVGAIRGVGINYLVVKEERIVAERVGLDDFRRVHVGLVGFETEDFVRNGFLIRSPQRAKTLLRGDIFGDGGQGVGCKLDVLGVFGPMSRKCIIYLQHTI